MAKIISEVFFFFGLLVPRFFRHNAFTTTCKSSVTVKDKLQKHGHMSGKSNESLLILYSQKYKSVDFLSLHWYAKFHWIAKLPELQIIVGHQTKIRHHQKKKICFYPTKSQLWADRMSRQFFIVNCSMARMNKNQPSVNLPFWWYSTTIF